MATTRKPAGVYEVILQGMAATEDTVGKVRDLASHASRLTGRPYTTQKLSAALGKLATAERGNVLTKVRDGQYKLTNPMLRPFVRLLFDHQYGRQLELPLS
ncbi:MAG TPA: hypothetical protein VHQ65_08980 [Thermoanaerobaculia bacterium]|nr:hypothetical protein [Thermoanaerobaculia bacterium]